MPNKNVLCVKKEKVGWITVHRPEAGNIDGSLITEELREICQGINTEEEISVVVIVGAGEVFSKEESWGELGESFVGQESSLIARKQPMWQPGVADAIAKIDCPVIAAIDGDALGQGLEVVLAADLRVASESSRFGFPYALHGLFPRDGGTQRLPRIVGKSKALEMLLTAELVDAAEAYRIGLVHKVVPVGGVISETEKLAKRIASKAPVSLKYAKEAVHKGMDLTLEQGLRLECDLYLILQTTEDRTKGIRAFLEKRAADFQGQ